MIELHPTVKVSHLADIEDSVRGTRIVVGAHSVIDSFVKVKPAGGVRSIAGEFNGERVVGQTWPAASGHLVFLELTY